MDGVVGPEAVPASRPRWLVAVASLVLVLLAGCGRGEFADRRAEVDIGGRTTTYTLDTCGLDGQTLFVVGRSTGGDVLQAVVGVEKDGSTGVPRSTGLTVTDDGRQLSAFGPESWQRRGESGPAPGRITGAALRGSRIRASGDLAVEDVSTVGTGLDGGGATDGGTSTGGASQMVSFTLDARCDDQSG